MIDRIIYFVRRPGLLQLARYVIVGGLVTGLVAGVYLLLADVGGVEPLTANLIAFAIGVVIGYGLHSSISFRDVGVQPWAQRVSLNTIAQDSSFPQAMFKLL